MISVFKKLCVAVIGFNASYVVFSSEIINIPRVIDESDTSDKRFAIRPSDLASTENSDAFVERFVSALSKADYQRAYALFDPTGDSYSAEQFFAMNREFQLKVGRWDHYDYIGTTVRDVHDQSSGSVLSLPAYIYRIKLDRFTTPLLLVLLMDASSMQPSILGYDFMPKETIDVDGVLQLWRDAITKH